MESVIRPIDSVILLQHFYFILYFFFIVYVIILNGYSLKRSNIITTCVICGILTRTADGNSAVKIEGGGGTQLYLYTVKIAVFRQILMSSLSQTVQ